MAAHGFSVRNHVAIVLTHFQATCRTLLVRHCNAAEVRWPARSVARVKRVEYLTREVIEAEFVEPVCVRAAEEFETVNLVFHEVGVERPRLR